MGRYVSVRGWLDLDHKHLPLVEQVIEAHRDDLYSGGWALPAAPFNWSLYVFYGGDLRESSVDWLRAQVEEIAALSPVDDDGDRPVGFFLLNDERQGSSGWLIRDGELNLVEAPAELQQFTR